MSIEFNPSRIRSAPFTVGAYSSLLIASLIIFVLVGWYAYQQPIPTIDEKIYGAFYGGMIAALATALGAIPVLFSQKYTQKTYTILLGFGSGVMLAACSFSLIIPGLEVARAGGLGTLNSAAVVGGGILLGALLMLLMDRYIPHEHFDKGREGPDSAALKRVWLFVIAITLHNLPEGLSIGMAFAGTNFLSAQALAMGISIQDIPEGMVVALALRGIGYSRIGSFSLSLLSGLVEPVAALIGLSLVSFNPALLPLGLSFAAGAMLFVISHEIIPESHREGRERYATVGLVFGFVLMMFLDTTV
jgi:ZIP family zinc transporter